MRSSNGLLIQDWRVDFPLGGNNREKTLEKNGPPRIRFSPEPKYNQQNLWEINLLHLLLKGTFGYVDNVGDMSYNNLNSASHKIKCHPEENE